MTRHGSDKGKGQGWHNYTTIYSVLFGKLHDQPFLIFELGLGTNNPNFPVNMGINGRPGASLRAWRELFPRALVYGADIDRDILFEEDRIKTFYSAFQLCVFAAGPCRKLSFMRRLDCCAMRTRRN
jgi:hypothetical protein